MIEKSNRATLRDVSGVASIGSAGLLLESSARMPLYRQLYEQLRAAILDGRLEPGAKLPSTRILAEELAVARNTVMGAYDQLLAEGYLEGAVRLGHLCH